MISDPGGRPRPLITVEIIEFATMIDLSLAALTRAWIIAVVASTLLVAALAMAQVWNSAVYLKTLAQALEVAGDGPAPIVDRWN